MSALSRRRLTAILSANIAGCRRHIDDEEGTVDALKGHLAIFERAVGDHGRHIVNTAGDGVLPEFPSSVRAMDTAIAIQKEIAKANDDRVLMWRRGPRPKAQMWHFV